MDLPTYTNIWRIEKRLYKLYDFRLPAPLPINWIAVFAGITVPYVLLLVAIGLPFNHNLVWLYVLPPGLLTWLTTRPVIENKRLPELLVSQVRYLAEPRVWCRLAPLDEKDEIVVVAKVWHSRRPAIHRQGEVAKRARATLVRQSLTRLKPERPVATELTAKPESAGKAQRLAAAVGSRVELAPPLRPVELRQPELQPQRESPQREPGVAPEQPVRVREVARGGRPPVRVEVAHGDAPDPVMDSAAIEFAPQPDPQIVAFEQPKWPHGVQTPDFSRISIADETATTDVVAFRAANGMRPDRSAPLEPGKTNDSNEIPPAAEPAPETTQAQEPEPVESEQEHEQEQAPESVAPEHWPSANLAAASGPAVSGPASSGRAASDVPVPEPVSAISKAPAPQQPQAAREMPTPRDAAARQETPAPVEPAPLPTQDKPVPLPVVREMFAAPAAPAAPSTPPQAPSASPNLSPPAAAQPSAAYARPVPSIERALARPGNGRTAADGFDWRRKVKVVTGATQGPGKRDQETLDRDRARLGLSGPKRILFLGCTSGAGQTVTALMTGYILASLREHPVAAVDLHDGALGRHLHPAADVAALLDGGVPDAPPSTALDGLPPGPRCEPVAGSSIGEQNSNSNNNGNGNNGNGTPGGVPDGRLDVITAGKGWRGSLDDAGAALLARKLGEHYPLAMLDPGPNGLTRLLHVADQLVVIVPASGDAAASLTSTRDWLEAHGFDDLAARSVTLINGVSRRSMTDVEAAESVARGRCRAIVRVPWDDALPVGAAGPTALLPQTRVAYTALAGVLVAGMAAAPVRVN